MCILSKLYPLIKAATQAAIYYILFQFFFFTFQAFINYFFAKVSCF